MTNKRDKSLRKKEKTRPQYVDEQTAFGSMPNPRIVKDKTTLERAQKMGLYTEADESHPHEIDLAEEIQEQDKERKSRGGE